MHLTALQGLCLVPAVLLTMPPDMAKEKVMHFAQMYKEDLDPSDSVQSELHSWRTKWMQKLSTSGQQSLPSTATTALQQASCMFPNIHILLKILCATPVTTCTSERSLLKRINTTLPINHGQCTAHWSCLATSASEDTSRHNSCVG